MNSLEFFELLLGVFIIIIFISYIIRKRKNASAPKYDERQQLLRSQSYRTAFWVLVIYLCANGIYGLITEAVWADNMTSSFIGICLAITVFVVICIQRDSYFPINQQPRFYFVLFVFIALVNLVTGVIRILNESDSFLTDGALNYNVMPFVIFAMFTAILISLLIRRQTAKSQDERTEP
jgi:high-affinity Fe2+/Pb2+ permease